MNRPELASITDSRQYQIEYSDSYILEEDAIAKLEDLKSRQTRTVPIDGDEIDEHFEYERAVLHGRPYLCSLPYVKPETDEPKEQPSEDDQKKDLIQAADRGWQLLQDMEGKQCLYYSTGWWSYVFCYNSYVKQFHAVSPAPGLPRVWPPQEDQKTPSYILGKYETKPKQSQEDDNNVQELTELRTRADGNYLVQKLDSGTPCDLTGKPRKVEIEFHCHPQTTDRIGWIKETTTCAYLMVIFTPRLCNDVAFQPSRDSQAHTISCQEILTVSDSAQLQHKKSETVAIEGSEDSPLMVGKIEVGAMKFIGKDGKKLERGRVVMTAEEQAETVIRQKAGKIQSVSKSKMKELNIEPDDVEAFRKQIEKIAGIKDWEIQRLGNGNGQIQLRAVVSADGDDGEEHYEAHRDQDEEDGSEEEYKNEL